MAIRRSANVLEAVLQPAVTRHARRSLSRTPTRSRAPPVLNLVTRPHFFSRVDASGTEYDGDRHELIPTFRCLDGQGQLLPGTEDLGIEDIPQERLVKMYETMSLLPIFDTLLYNSQRQGRLSFYMTSYGEEASVVCSAAAWSATDELFAQYREQGVLLWRGMPLDDMLAQCFGSARDRATKGRQMPVHYGSKDLHFHTISSPLATQIPQAAGAAYALKRTAARGQGRDNDCVIVYVGEGACSEGDFHAGMNMASVLGGPLVMLVRNNSFAISTPAIQQFAGDGIASRAPGYGIEAVRVDGNDPLAVHLACLEARRRAIEQCKPVLVEAMSYRVGHHSTSDDSSAYRARAEVDNIKRQDNPLHRMRSYLEHLGLWSAEKETEVKTRHKREVMAAFNKAEKEPLPPLSGMFEDVYGTTDERPTREQRAEVKRLVEKYGEASPAWKAAIARHEGGAGTL